MRGLLPGLLTEGSLCDSCRLSVNGSCLHCRDGAGKSEDESGKLHDGKWGKAEDREEIWYS